MARGVALAASLGAPAFNARAATKLVYGYSAVSDFATVFVGTEQGFFTKRDIELGPRIIPINPTIIPGVQSGSLQMGRPTPTGHLHRWTRGSAT